MKAPYSDIEIIEGIKAKDEKVLMYIYNNYRPMVIDYVTKNSGTEREAEDVLHDAIIRTYDGISKRGFSLKKRFDVYFPVICRNTWKYSVRIKNRYVYSGFLPDILDDTDEDMCNRIQQEQLQKIILEKFRALDEKCRDVLKLYYFKKMRMKEIADMMSYKYYNIAVNKKYLCLENLKVLIKGSPVYKKFKNDE